MPNIGMVELMIIAITALIVIGPKDLPKVFHNVGKMTAKLRSMSREFSRAMEDAARESGVDGMAKDLRDISNPSKLGLDAVKDAAKGFDDWDPAAKVTKPETRGPNTAAMTEERREAAKKIRDAAAERAQKRLDAEKGGSADVADDAASNAADTAAKKAVKKTPAKKAPAKKTPAKKTATKRTTEKKTTSAKSKSTKGSAVSKAKTAKSSKTTAAEKSSKK